MAFSATTVWENQTGGSDTDNGGGFDPGNANMLTDGAATVANTSAPVFTSASYNFVAGDVGHWVYIKSGTNWTPGWYKIASVAANAATLTGTIGAAVLASGVPTTVVGCASTASPTGATWAIDYSQTSAVRFSYTDLVIDGTTNTNATSAAFPFGKQMVGNIWNVTAGTGFTVQRAQLVSVATVTATFDKSLGTLSSTGGTAKMGGSLSTPGLASSLMVAGNDLFIKSGTYTVTSASTNVTAGCLAPPTSASNANITNIFGYASVRGDRGTKPIIKADGVITTFTLLSMGSNSIHAENLELDGNSRTSSRGVSNTGNNGSIWFCTIKNCTNNAFSGSSTGFAFGCYFTGCSTASVATGPCFFCVAAANTVTAFANFNAFYCVAAANTGASTDGFATPAGVGQYIGCVAYGNGRHGFNCAAGNPWTITNCIASANTGTGFISNASCDNTYLVNCAAFGNVTNFNSSWLERQKINCQDILADPFTNAAGGNFALNSTAGAGALLRAAGYPSAFPGISTSSYRDIGAAQHLESSSVIVVEDD